MAHGQHTPTLDSLEEAITILLCLLDDTYTLLNPDGPSHQSLKRLSDSEVLTLALFQQLRGIESERSFLRDAQRFISVLLAPVSGRGEDAPLIFAAPGEETQALLGTLAPRSPARVARRSGDPHRVDSTLLEVLHPRQVGQWAAGFEGAEWLKWGSFALYVL
jgi:hypothetical protein